MRLSRAEPPGHAPEHSGCNDHRILLGLLIMARLIRGQSVLLSVALAATLWSSAALSQAETETEVVETVPTAQPAPPRPVSDEPSAPTPPVVAPNTASETAPAPLPTGAPTTGPLESAAVPLPTGAPTSRPVESPAQAPKGSLAVGPNERHSAT